MHSLRSLLLLAVGRPRNLSAGAPRTRRWVVWSLLVAGSALLHSQPAYSQSKIFYITNSNASILEAELDGSNGATVYEGMPAPNGMDVDAANDTIYWVDGILGKIFRANTDGTGQEELVSGLMGPSDVALDLTNDKMYWTDLNAGEIGRADLDGSNVETQLSGLSGPVAIAVDPGGGKFYWTDDTDGTVKRADFDGTNEETIRGGMFGVSGIGLDLTNSKVYWIDAFGQIDRDDLGGGNYESLNFEVGDFMAIDGAGGKVYWTDQLGQQVNRSDLDGTNVENIVTGLDGPVGIGLDLTNSKVYWTDPMAADRVQRANLDGTTVEAVLTPEIATAGDLAVSGGKIYWTDSGSGKVRRANVDFSSPEDLVTGQTTPIGIQVDESGSKMYWIDAGTSKIQRADLDGSNAEDLVTGLTDPRHIDLDVSGGKMYWTDGTDGEVREANLDGTSEAAVVTGLTSPFGIAVGSLYWADNGNIVTSANDGSGQSTLVSQVSTHGVALDASGGKVYYIEDAFGQLRRMDTDGSNDELLISGLFGPTDLALSIETQLTESTVAAGLSGSSPAVAGAEVQVFGIGITGDGTNTVNSIDITLSDLTSATGLAASDISELRLYSSTDILLDGGDTQIGNETTINIGSATTVSATTPDTPGNGTEVFYLISAVIAASPNGGATFRVGFAANGVTTSGSALGTAVTAADANNVEILHLTESTAAVGLSGASTAEADDEVQILSIGITGDGTSALFGIDVTLSDLTSATGLAASDFTELRLYSSTDATLDGGDTQIGDETTINIGSATTVAADTPNVPADGTEVFYLLSAVIASAPEGGHTFRVGFATNGATTSLGFLGTAVTAADADNVEIRHLAESTAAAGLSGSSTVTPSAETQIFSVGITGDGTSTVNSIAVTLSDLTSATGLAAADFTELRLYSSTDATLDGGDTQIGNETTINIGSATTIAATTPDVPGAGTEVFYLVSAVIAASPTAGHSFRLGFAANGVTTSLGTLGTAVTAADANNVAIQLSGLTESTAAAGLSGSTPAAADDEVQIFTVGITGDGGTTVNSIGITLSDLTSATGLAASDLAELRLYSSTDATLDGGDTQIGTETTINIGSATTVSASTPDTPGNGTEVFYLISAVVESAPNGGVSFRVGFAANGVTTSGSALGTVVTAADADNVEILHLAESTAAAGLSGSAVNIPDDEVQIFSVGITGDGTSALFGIAVTLSDLTSATGLAAADISELRLYSSTDATLDGADTQIGNETTINIGSATTVAATTPDVPADGTEVFYLISAVVASSPTSGHTFRVGFAANGVTTSLGTLGTAVTAADADNVVINVPSAAGLSFTTQPVDTIHLGTLSVVVSALDTTGSVDPTFSSSVTLTASAGTLTNATVTAVSGVATFTGMTISGAGANQTLTANGGGLNGTSNPFDVDKAVADITLSNLGVTYSAESQSPTVTTDPAGLTVDVTYDGSSDQPIDPGSYDLIVTVDDDDYQGTRTSVFTIADPPAPEVEFVATVTSGLTPLEVTFSDTVTGFVTQRIYELFDDESTVLIDPADDVTVTYNQAGTFDAALFFRAIGVRRGERRIPITAYSLAEVDDQITDEGLTITIPLLPAEALEIVELTVEPELAGASLEDGVWSWKTNLEQAGLYTITATASDVHGTRQTRSFTVVVNESQPPILLPNPEKLDFGNVLAGYSLEYSVDLTNPSDLPVTLEALELDSPAFTLFPPDMPVTLAPDSSVTFRARYDAVWGERPSVAAVVASTDHGPFLMPIAGRSLWAELQPDTAMLDFEEILPGEDAQLHFHIDNTGTIPVRGVAQIDAPSFEVSPRMFTIEPGLSERLTVTFSPVEADSHAASLRFVGVEPVVGPTLVLDPIAVPNPGTIPVDEAADASQEDASTSRLEKRVAGLQFEDVPIPLVGFASRLVVADFNRDRVVDMADFRAFHKAVFREVTPDNAVFDLTHDGHIDVADLFRFSDVFGEVTPRILARPAQLDPVSREHLMLYGRAIGSMTADLARGALRPGRTVNHTRFGTSAALAIDVHVPVQLGMSHVEYGAAAYDGLSAQLVTTGSSPLPDRLAPHSYEPQFKPPTLPVTDIPVGFVTTEGEELALHGNVVTLPGGRARFDFGPLRSSWQPSIQEEIRRTRDFRPDLTQMAIEAHCGGDRYVTVDKVFAAMYDSGLRTESIGERYGIVATNSVAYDCDTQKYAADFNLHYFRSAQSANGPALSEDFIVSESLLR